MEGDGQGKIKNLCRGGAFEKYPQNNDFYQNIFVFLKTKERLTFF